MKMIHIGAAAMRSNGLVCCAATVGLTDKLLLKPKAGRSLQTECVPRSSGENAKCHIILFSGEMDT